MKKFFDINIGRKLCFTTYSDIHYKKMSRVCFLLAFKQNSEFDNKIHEMLKLACIILWNF